jgi:CHAT domain-containing protein/Tfp pilus assembly protein PilF
MRRIGTVLMAAVFAGALVPFAGVVVAAESGAADAPQLGLQPADQLIAQANAARREKKSADAVPLYEKALAIKVNVLGAMHSALAPVLEALGATHKDLGQNQQALTYLQRALEVNERNFGVNNARVAVNLNDIAALHQAAGRYAAALPLYQRALAILEQALGADNPNVAATLSNLAGLYRDSGEPVRALPLFQRSVSIFEKAYGAEHINVAGTLNNLAGVHRALGQFPEALRLYERSLAIYEKTLGTEHIAVAAALNNLAVLHRAMANYAPALPLYQRSLAIYEKAYGPSHVAVATSLNNLALLYLNIGDYEQSLQLYRRSLAISEKVLGPDHRDVAAGLNNLADLHRTMGQYAIALPIYERSLAIREKALGPNHPDVANSLNNLAELYRATGEYAKSLPLHERALAIHERTGGPEHPMAAASLNNIALVYWRMGERAKALAHFQRSLATREKTLGPEHLGVSNSLNNVALAYRYTGDYARALPLLLRSLAINEKMQGPENQAVATTLSNLSELYREMGDYAKALPVAERSLAIREKAFGLVHPDVALSLLSLARLHWMTGKHEQAQRFLHRALPIAAGADAPETLWRVQDGLRTTYGLRRQNDLAIFFGKQAVNTIQNLRARLAGLDQDLQRSFLEDKLDVYRGVVDVLIAEGRLPEAQQITTMLKEEEYFDFVRRDEKRESRTTQVPFTDGEEPWRKRYGEISAQLGALGAELGALDRKARAGLSEEETTRREKLRADRSVAQKAFDAFLGDFMRELAQAGGQRNREIGERGLTNLRALQGTLATLGHGAVAIHYLVGDERLNILVTTPSIQIARTVNVTSRELNQQIAHFQSQLQDPGLNPIPMAQALYRTLVAPIIDDLRQAKAQTLMVSLDGALRYIPLAVLHDGKRFLIEDYRVAIFNEAAKDKLKDQPQATWRVAAMGLTRQHQNFSALPSVKGELEGIIRAGDRGVLPGEVHLDDAFTANRLRAALDKAYPVLHLASHFKFQPGTEANSFLLLGDGKHLSLKDLKEDDYRFEDVDLITLSACETAVGGGKDANGMEIEGLGALAQKQGAKGVLATLWPVADESTGLLMQQFYRLREAGKLTKAESLRQAQLGFINGGRGDSNAAAAKGQYRHPFYWAPFILMGNWL